MRRKVNASAQRIRVTRPAICVFLLLYSVFWRSTARRQMCSSFNGINRTYYLDKKSEVGGTWMMRNG